MRKESCGLPAKYLAVVTSAIFLVPLFACVGATRLPARAQGTSGATIDEKQLDLSFLQVGVTRREEVIKKLSMIDSGYSDPGLFWGRWADSKWGYWWVVAGGYSSTGDAKRVWHVKNLLVTFDKDGVMRDRQEIVDDDKLLWRRLHEYVSQAPPFDPGQQVSISTTWAGITRVTLIRDGMEIERRKKPPVSIPASKVVRISHGGKGAQGGQTGSTCHMLHFLEKTGIGKAFAFCADAPTVVAVFQYFQKLGPAEMRWE